MAGTRACVRPAVLVGTCHIGLQTDLLPYLGAVQLGDVLVLSRVFPGTVRSAQQHPGAPVWDVGMAGLG